MRFSVLGPLEVSCEGQPVRLSGVKQRATLGFLLLHANEVVATARLTEVLWAQDPPPSARQVLQNALAGLRQAFARCAGGEPPALLTSSPGYLLRVDPERIDVHRFRAVVAQGRAEMVAGAWESASKHFRQALAIRRGPVLADVTAAGIAWPELAAVEDEQLAAVEACFDAELACGRHGELVGEMEMWCRAHPLREWLCGQLMLALYRSGRQTDALAAYRRIRTALADGLGLDPGPDLRALEHAILTHDRELALSRLPIAVTTRVEPPALPAGPVGGTGKLRLERKRISVLLIGFSLAPLVEGDPERFDELAGEVAAVVRDKVSSFGGTVLSVDGSLCAAVFGAPRVHEDDAERAVRAAVAIRDQLGAQLQGMAPDAAAAISATIATGDELVKILPDDAVLSENTALPAAIAGPVLDACHRLLALARPGEIRVCGASRSASSRAVSYPAAPASGGGWIVLAVRPSQARSEPEPDDSVPFLGRERELAMLIGALDDVTRRARPRMVTVLGQLGIGKSRLVAEFARRARDTAPGVRVLVGHTRAFGEDAALMALAMVVYGHAGIACDDPPAVAEDKLRRAVDSLDTLDTGLAGWLLSHLRPLVGLANRRPAAGETGESFSAWRRYLEELAVRQPLVVVFEDMHWADDTMLDFLADLAGSVAAVPLLVLTTARPEFMRRRGDRPSLRGTGAITLPPLNDEAIGSLFGTLVPAHGRSVPCSADPGGSPADEFCHTVVAKVGGIPLFAVEYARMLRDGWADLAGPGQEPLMLPLPETVQSVIAARLDALPAGKKAVLQDASILGEGFRADAVAVLNGQDVDDVVHCLDCLAQRDLLRRAGGAAPGERAEYEFAHVLVRDVAYGQLPRTVRAEMHYRAALWFQGLPGQLTPLIAHHYRQAVVLSDEAGRPSRALGRQARIALADVGRKAAGLGAWSSAVRCYQTALELCPPDDPDRPGLLLEYGKSLVACHGSRGGEVLLEARDALLAAGDRVAAAGAEITLASERLMDSDERAADDHLRRSVQLIEGLAPSEALVEAQAALAYRFAVRGWSAGAIAFVDRVMTAAETLDRPDLQAQVLEARGMVRVQLGDARGIADAERAARILGGCGITTARTLNNLAWSLAEVGDLRRRWEVDVEAHQVAEQYGDRLAKVVQDAMAPMDDYWAGSWDTAVQRIARQLTEGNRARPQRVISQAYEVRARIRLARGDVAGAAADVAEVMKLGDGVTEPGFLHPQLVLRARLALLRTELDQVRDLVERMLATAMRWCVTPDLGVDLPLVMAAAGYPARVLDVFPPSRWLEAARLFLDGDPLGAARTYALIGSVPDETYARLEAARRMFAAGSTGPAAEQLRIVTAAAREMGAGQWQADAELLARTMREQSLNPHRQETV